jgi:hypothetical protein
MVLTLVIVVFGFSAVVSVVAIQELRRKEDTTSQDTKRSEGQN